MRTIGFIGAYDKTDLIIYIAKLLVEMQRKVLMIDATTLQKSRYTVPNISPSKTYITEFEGIDIAVGFNDYDSIKYYMGIPSHAVFDYDYILIDVDSPEAFQEFGLKTATKNYFITGCDPYSLKRGLEILSGVDEPIPLKQVVFSMKNSNAEEKYLDYVFLGSKVIWNSEKIYFPFEKGDQTTIIENQRVAKIKFKKLTRNYKDGLMYVAQDLIDPSEAGDLGRAFRQL